MTPAERAFSERFKPSSSFAEELRERGFPAAQPSPVSPVMPPLDGLWSVPAFQQFSAVYNWASRTYNWTYDEAIKDSRLNAKVMRNDYIIKPALRNRATPVCQTDWQLEPLDGSNAKLTANAAKLTTIMKRIPRFQQLKRSILDYHFFGRSAVQMKTKIDYSYGYKAETIADWTPIHPDSLVFKYDDETVGVLVNMTAYDGEVDYTPVGPAHFFTPNERELIIVGEFEPESVDYYDPDMAGSLKGLGYRGTLYWLWWLREKLTSILMDFLEKVGMGVTIFFYESGNPKSKIEVENAAKNQMGNNVFIFPRDRDGRSAYSGPGIERVEVSMRGAETFLNIFNMLNNLMRFAIMGEVGTTEEMSAGLGSSVGEQHGITADQRIKYDAVDLEWPMQQLTNALNRWNCPGDPAPLFKFLVDKRNPAEFMQSVQFAIGAGLTVASNDIRDELSLRKPEPGEETLGGPQPLQPSSVGGIPQGMPMTGPAGPQGDASQQPVEQGQPVDPSQQQPQPSPNGNGQAVTGIPVRSSLNGVGQ